MPTIVFASPKGGVGKSTAAILLATELGATALPSRSSTQTPTSLCPNGRDALANPIV